MTKDEKGLPDGVSADSPDPGESRSNDEGIITESAGGVKPPAALTLPDDVYTPAKMQADVEQMAQERPEHASLLTRLAENFGELQTFWDDALRLQSAELLDQTCLAFIRMTNVTTKIFHALADPEKLRALLDEARSIQLEMGEQPPAKPAGYTLQHPHIVSGKIPQVIHASLMDGSLWEDDLASFRRVSNGRTSSTPHVRLVVRRPDAPPAEVFTDPGILALWMAPLAEVTSRFDDLRGDIHVILQMHWLEHKEPDGWAVISPADLMAYRNKKLWGGSKTVMRNADLRVYSDALRDVLRPELEGSSGPLRRYNKRRRRYEDVDGLRFTGPVWHAEIIDLPTLMGPACIERVRYAPNSWMKCCLEPYAREIARVTPQILAFDIYRQTKQKRIGWHLTYLFRINRGPVELFMKTLLTGAGIGVPGKKQRNPTLFIESIEKAIGDCYDAEVIGDFECLNTDPLPRKGKLAAWLKRKWVFRPMPDRQDEYDRVQQHRAAAIEKEQKAAERRKQKALTAGS